MTKNIKIFTDPYGEFQMLTPVGYQYKNPGFERAANEPHAFGGYENNMGAFQISCKPVNAQIADLIMKRGMLIQTAATKKLLYQKTTNDFGDMITHVWMAAIEDHFVLATYIYEKKFIKRAEKELENVQACLESFKFIKPEFREVVLAERRYTMFMASTAAAIELRNKALENGSFIEIVILTANRIDGLLRLAIMLNKQLENQNDEIDTALLFQDEQDKIVAERAIYKMGLEQGIITQDIYDRLELLYKERNKVVHRYIITDIRTEQVIKIVFEYYDVEELVDKVINDLEMKQFTMKIGINANTEPGKLGESGMERLMASVKDKHGNINWGPKEEKIRKIPIKKT